MCDPVSLIGMALSTAGAYSQAQSQAAYVDEVNRQNKIAADMSQKAREAERVRQRQFEQEGIEAFDKTQGDLTRETYDADRTAASDEFISDLDARPTPVTAETRLPGQEGASVAVTENINTKINSEAAKTRERIKAFSELAAYSGAGQNRATSLMGAGDTLSTIGGLRRGSLAVGNQEQNVQPGTVRQGNTAFADILSGIGGVMSYGGPDMFKGVGTGLAPATSIRPMANPRYRI
jgi:hypothetical protein